MKWTELTQKEVSLFMVSVIFGRLNILHEENGFYFTVTEELFQKVEDFVLNKKI